LNEEEWKKILPKNVWHSRMKGTELPGSSEFEHSSEVGTYYAACGNPLFKVIQNLKVVAAGPAFMNRSVKQVSLIQLTELTAW
jgi:peptide-methionine (R)-S-oxide reductase